MPLHLLEVWAGKGLVLSQSFGMTEVFKMYDASHATRSVEDVAQRMDASAIWSPHRMTALD